MNRHERAYRAGELQTTINAKLRAYELLMHPTRQKVTQDQFDQILYDAIHRDKTQPPAAILRWAHRYYEIVAAVESDGTSRVGPREARNLDELTEKAPDQPNNASPSLNCGPGVKHVINPDGHESSRAYQVFHQKNGDVTKQYYADLCAIGPIGVIAMNLFRAQKRSNAAKAGRRFRGDNYDVKAWSMAELAKILNAEAQILDIRWGWKEDPKTVFGERASWVLYVELPKDIGQVSFHSPTRGLGPAYVRDWDGVKGASETRICQFADWVEARHERQAQAAP